jgi:hypothetical protein
MSGDDVEEAKEKELRRADAPPRVAQGNGGDDAYDDERPSGGGDGGGGDDPQPSLDEVDVKNLLRAALKPPKEGAAEIKKGVQKKIREASGGRFFADGWSTAEAPRETYLITAVLMLVIVIAAFLLLGPTFL